MSGNGNETATDTVTATGADDDGNSIDVDGSFGVDIEDTVPSINVVKTANPTSVQDPGGDVTFSVSVTNTSGEDVTLDGLVDDIHGDLDGQDDVADGSVTITAGSTYGCAFTVFVSGSGGSIEVDTVTATASDDEGNEVNDADSASVVFGSSSGNATLSKTADPSSLPEPGGAYTFTVTLVNDNELAGQVITLEITHRRYLRRYHDHIRAYREH